MRPEYGCGFRFKSQSRDDLSQPGGARNAVGIQKSDEFRCSRPHCVVLDRVGLEFGTTRIRSEGSIVVTSAGTPS